MLLSCSVLPNYHPKLSPFRSKCRGASEKTRVTLRLQKGNPVSGTRQGSLCRTPDSDPWKQLAFILLPRRLNSHCFTPCSFRFRFRVSFIHLKHEMLHRFQSSLHGGHADLPCVVSVLVHVLMKRAAHLDFLSKEKVSKETLSLVFILCYLLETSRGQNSAVFKIKTCVCERARARVCV